MLLPPKRSFERREPERDAKCVYIFCEGIRECNYFSFFEKLSEKIKVEIYPIDSESDDNTPTGLYRIACNCLKPSEENPNPKFDLSDDVDEVWIVFDKDVDKTLSREPQIFEVRKNCINENQQLSKNDVWNVAESNPCFEVWLYYHFQSTKPDFKGIEISANWKPFVDSISKGGFDHRKHPQLIGDAIKNAKTNYHEVNERPGCSSTQAYRLGESIYSVVKNRLKVDRV
jgi:hypothetical protein